GPAPVPHGAERAVDGPQRGRVRAPEGSPPDLGLHVVDRSGRDEHDHRRGACDREPASGAPTARRRLRLACLRSRPAAARAAVARAVAAIRSAKRPLVVAGGGVIYSCASDALRRFADETGIPVAETQAGKGSLPYDHPASLGAIGATGTSAANRVAKDADLVIGIGTRWRQFTTASKTVFQDPNVRFVNVH